MPDDADIAGPRHDKAVADAISRVPRPGGQSARYCIDCDDPIPEARRQAYQGCQRCVQCEEDFWIEAKRR